MFPGHDRCHSAESQSESPRALRPHEFLFTIRCGEHIHHGYRIRGDESKQPPRVSAHWAPRRGRRNPAGCQDSRCRLRFWRKGRLFWRGSTGRKQRESPSLLCMWRWPTKPWRTPAATPGFCALLFRYHQAVNKAAEANPAPLSLKTRRKRPNDGLFCAAKPQRLWPLRRPERDGGKEVRWRFGSTANGYPERSTAPAFL